MASQVCTSVDYLGFSGLAQVAQLIVSQATVDQQTKIIQMSLNLPHFKD